jgi:anti-sigma factor RsiW
MGESQKTTACERAGQLISVRLDGELSELEAAALDRHLERCAACTVLATELTGIAALLRSAPLVGVERELAPVVPGRPRVLGRARPAAFAAVMSAAAAAVAFIVLGSSSPPRSSQDGLQFRSASEEIRFVRVQQQRIEPPVETPPPMNPRMLL